MITNQIYDGSKVLKETVKQAAHSHIGASSMHRWSVCPGSVRLSKDLPPAPSSIYAEEGTYAHGVASDVLQDKRYPPFDDKFTEEMKEAIEVYVGEILNTWAEMEPHKHNALLVEQRFDLSKLHPGLFGTADCVIYDFNKKLLRVFDYKHGAGLPVEVEDNPQLLYYGLGALLTNPWEVLTVELIIVQPRCYHVSGPIRRQSLSVIDLLDFSQDVVKFASRTEIPNAPLVLGEHCKFCPAAAICPEKDKETMALMKEDFVPAIGYDPARLKRAYEAIEPLKAWIKSVEDFVYGEAMRGNVLHGYKLVQKRSTRKWKSEGDVSYFFTTFLGFDEHDLYEKKFKSPAQMEKLLPKEDKGALAELVTNESSGVTLAPISDTRPEVKNRAALDFEPIT